MKSVPEVRIIVLAPIGRDAQLICESLARHNFYAFPFKVATDAVAEARKGAGLAIIAEEIFSEGGLREWTTFLESQPTWSDFPLIVLCGRTAHDGMGRVRAVIRRKLGNVTMLERPISIETLVSAVESGLRARLRQYEIRDFIDTQRKAEEALRHSERLAVAGRLAASIAHEINNPLEAVTNLIYLIGTANTVEECRQFAQYAQNELQRVSDITNQTLRFHRTPNEPSKINITAVLDSTLTLFKARLRGHSVTVEKQYRVKGTVNCIEGEIRQVIINLIGNAIDSMREGGQLTVRVRDRKDPKKGHDGIRILIADQGTGISDDVRKKIFEAFFTTKGSTGTGLGLWISKGIVERHDGRLRFRSRLSGKGTVFSVWLPCQSEKEEEKESAEALAS